MTGRLLGVVTRIRDIGVADQPVSTARRLRTVNIVVLLACLFTSGYCLLWAIYDLEFFAREVAFLAVMVALYASVFLASRAGLVDLAMWMLVAFALTHIGVINWLLGPNAGALAYLLTVVFIVSLLIREGDRVSVWPIAIVVAAMFFSVTFFGRQGSIDALPEHDQRVIFFANIFGAAILAAIVSLFFRWLIARAEAELQAETARGDRLLRAILPEPIAERLKRDEQQVVAESYGEATILFADIVRFMRRSSTLDPGQVVADLNGVFVRIDELAAARGVEKIKTIGDAYFAVAGVPEPAPDHAERMAEFALDLREATPDLAASIWPDLQFRIVIHAGPVVAGVIGRSKFAYDVWGDTVNTTARLEEICEPGEILISDAVRAALPPRFLTGDRGAVDLRDKGRFALHRLEGRD